MHYEEIHPCPDDHVIYYNQHEFATECPKCHVSRYRIDKVTKKVPQKVLRYIPIRPCFQRLFRCKNIAQFMDYHARNRSQDDVIRMPTDGTAFRHIEESGLTLKKNHVILGLLWQLMVLIHLHT